MGLYVADLWRYPVKTLAGERLPTAAVGFDGIFGDRAIWVVGPEGVRTSRQHYRLLGLHGSLSGEGYVLINGYPWQSPEALALVKRAAGDDAWLEASDVHDRFDVMPLRVATDGTVAALGRGAAHWQSGGASRFVEDSMRLGTIAIGDSVTLVRPR